MKYQAGQIYEDKEVENYYLIRFSPNSIEPNAFYYYWNKHGNFLRIGFVKRDFYYGKLATEINKEFIDKCCEFEERCYGSSEQLKALIYKAVHPGEVYTRLGMRTPILILEAEHDKVTFYEQYKEGRIMKGLSSDFFGLKFIRNWDDLLKKELVVFAQEFIGRL